MSFKINVKIAMRIQAALVIGIATLSPIAAQGQIISGYGAHAGTSTASNCPSYCTTANGGDFQYAIDGGEFSISATALENSYATADAFSSLSGSTYLPTLKVNTLADAGKGGFATAFAIQGYTYTGPDTTISLDVFLHGSVGNNANGSYTYNNLNADVAVLFGNELDFYANYSTLLYEIATDLPSVELGHLAITSGTSTIGGSIMLDLVNGDEFFVVAQMNANSLNGYVDAWNTLSMSFDNDAGLVAASVVPVPAAVWLFGSGLLGLVGIARRKQS